MIQPLRISPRKPTRKKTHNKKSRRLTTPEALMKRFIGLLIAGVFAAVTLGGPAQTGTGTIKGHIKITGKLPGNQVIRMGVDPKCGQLNQGKQAVDEVYKATADGSLANVFVRLEGTFPKTPVPTMPVVLD